MLSDKHGTDILTTLGCFILLETFREISINDTFVCTHDSDI